jgi:transcription antitermination factor NusG
MVWIRFARIQAVWRCYTTRGYSTKYHVVGVAIKDEYEKRPIEDIDTWARILGDFVVDKMCTNSCESLSTSVFCDKTSLRVDVIYTSETLVAKPRVKKGEEEEKKKKEVPKYILGQIEILEERYKEAATTDEKLAIRAEINKLKQRYGIEIVPMKPIEVKPIEMKPLISIVPKYILGQIEILEERYKEAATTDEKLAIRAEINKLKERYSIMSTAAP